MKAIEVPGAIGFAAKAEHRAGLPRQKEANAKTIEKYNLRITKTITLEDVSGTAVLHTPEFQSLLSDIKSPEISGVVVADMDRLSRFDNYRDWGLLQDLKDSNTVLYTSDSVIDFNTQTGSLVGGLQSLIGGNELVQIKKRMIEAKEIKRRDGKHPGNHLTLPLGVGYDRLKEKYYYTDQIWKVKTLFRLFHDEGIHNYRELERQIGIQHRTVANLLKNELYIGYRTYTEKRSSKKEVKPNGRQGDKKKIKRRPDEIIRVKVIDEPLIDKATFKEVQKIIKTKYKSYRGRKAKEGERFLYSGFLKCGICGELIYSTSGGRNHKKDYYYCRSKNYLIKKKHGESNCSSSYMPKQLIDKTITSFVGEKLVDKDYLRHLISRTLSDDSNEKYKNEAYDIRDRLRKLERKKDKLLELYLNDNFSMEKLDQKVGQLNRDIEVLKNRLVKIEAVFNDENKIKIKHRMKSIISTLSEFSFWNPIQKRTFLKSQIPEFHVTKEGISSFTLNFCNKRNRTGKGSWPPPA